MPISDKPTPKTEIGSRCRKQLERLQEHAQDEEKAIKNEAASRWYRPDGEDAGIYAIEEQHEPFTREQQEDEFLRVIKTEAPGTTGDLIGLLLQGELMHTFERAYRQRHHSVVRTRVQPGGRKFGHGHEHGVIRGGLLGYLINVDRINKDEQGGDDNSLPATGGPEG